MTKKKEPCCSDCATKEASPSVAKKQPCCSDCATKTSPVRPLNHVEYDLAPCYEMAPSRSSPCEPIYTNYEAKVMKDPCAQYVDPCAQYAP